MTELVVKKNKFLNQVGQVIESLIGDDKSARPIVCFSSAWPFLNELEHKNAKGVDQILDVVLEVVGKRSFLMPTFTRGFVNGLANLDTESSTTGIMSESYRKRPGIRRTLSAYFSFAVGGPDTEQLCQLKANHAWGQGSVYEWMEKTDVQFLMLGTHPTHCSYLHRLEYLQKDHIPYRFNKKFEGKIIREGLEHDVSEVLYVRNLNPVAINDFTVLTPDLFEAGMKSKTVNGVPIASYSAAHLVKTILPKLAADPLLVLKNKKDYEVIK
jgi:aminoglycoside N3'-acetyltransferase